nr:hypothetical protein [Tanacetum cinerariifolium]
FHQTILKKSKDCSVLCSSKIVRLKERVQVLEDREEEIARVLTSIDAAIVLAGGIDVPTGSGFIPTAGPPATVISTGSEVGPTASPTVTGRKGKEVMVESDTPKKKKLQEQIDAQVARELEEQQEKENMRMNEHIARDAEVARIHAEEELQGMIDSLDKIHTAKTFDLVWIWLGGDYENVFINRFSWDSVLNMCRNYLHGSLSEQRTHEFMYIYLATTKKGEFKSDFHPMVDFIAASPLRYALTVKPTIFVSHIRQFWSTARIETTDEGTHILATVDGI